jgi:hypothetical protein
VKLGTPVRYFFDVSGSSLTTHDTEGTELACREEAAAEAARILAEIAFHHLKKSEEETLTLQVAVREGIKVLLCSPLTIETEECS